MLVLIMLIKRTRDQIKHEVIKTTRSAHFDTYNETGIAVYGIKEIDDLFLVYVFKFYLKKRIIKKLL